MSILVHYQSIINAVSNYDAFMDTCPNKINSKKAGIIYPGNYSQMNVLNEK